MIRRDLISIKIRLAIWALSWSLPVVSGAWAEESPRASDEESVAAAEEEPGVFLVAGTFKSAYHSGLLGRLSNYVFEYENDDSLFRDFGDLGIGIGGDIGTVGVNFDLNFRHRVVSSHVPLSPAETITSEDLSYYRKVGTSRTRLRVDWEYIPEVFTDDDGVSIQVEGGYSVSASRAQLQKGKSEDPLEGLIMDSAGAGYTKFKEENEVSTDRHGVVYVTAGSAAAVVDSLAGYVGNRFADTERAAIYWDNYAEPIMLFPKTGIPLKLRVFLGEDKTLATGDRLTFTSFFAVSPIVAGINQYGARIGYRYFWRFLRETTVRKLEDSVVEVRVRNWRGRGSEVTPFKFRPEVRLWIIRIGYTFFESVFDRFRERTSDVVYKVDLKTETGMEFFKKIVKQSGRVNPNPKLPDPKVIEGVETVVSEVSKGRNQNFRVRGNFFSWYHYRANKIGSARRISTHEVDLNEAVRVRSKEYERRFGRHRDVRSRSVIVAQSDVQWRDNLDHGITPEDEKLAVLISSNYSNRWASEEDIQAMAHGVDAILGVRSRREFFDEFKNFESEDPLRMTIYLDLSFGPEQLARSMSASDDQMWSALGEIMLGPELGDAWSTEARRYWWEPGAPLYRGVDPPVRDISRHYDKLRGFEGRPPRRSRIFYPAEYSSRDLYRLGKSALAKMGRLAKVFGERPDCVRCLVKGYSTNVDVYLIQALSVRFAGGVEKGGVGYDFDILVGNMVRPLKITNGIRHGYQMPRGGDILRTAEQTWESPPRLRAGQALVNVSGADHELSEEEPCGVMRLFSDHYFDDDLALRIIWRRARMGADRSLRVDYASLGEPREFTEEEAAKGRIDYSHARSESALSSEFSTFDDRALSMQYGSTPFSGRYEQARYFYDIHIPYFLQHPSRKGFTVLLRVLNEDGLPVTEEQTLLLRFPRDWAEQVPSACFQTEPEGEQTAEDTEPAPEIVN